MDPVTKVQAATVGAVSGPVLAYGAVWALRYFASMPESAFTTEAVLFLSAILSGPAAFLSGWYRKLGA